MEDPNGLRPAYNKLPQFVQHIGSLDESRRQQSARFRHDAYGPRQIGQLVFGIRRLVDARQMRLRQMR